MKILNRITIQTLNSKKGNTIKQTWVLRSLVREKEFRPQAKGLKKK